MPEVQLTIGHMLRHAPAASAMGREAAIVDAAQDLLLRHLFEQGALDAVVFKGGTALRKLYAGERGRFSTDLDFAVRDLADDSESVVSLLADEIAGVEIGPFRYGITVRRGKRHLTIDSELGNVEQLSSKLDVNPPPWLPPQLRSWVPMPSLDELGEQLAADYAFLGALDEQEIVVARSHGADRDLVLEMLADLPGGRLVRGTCW